MSMTADVGEAAIVLCDKLRGKIGQTKVKRYWPSKIFEWANESDTDDLLDIEKPLSSSLDKAFPLHDPDPHVVPYADDRRLVDSRSDHLDEVRADHRRIRQAEIVSTIQEEVNNFDNILDLHIYYFDLYEKMKISIRKVLQILT